MNRRLAALAAAWRRFWARENLPSPPGRPPEGGDASCAPRRGLRTLLARDTLPQASPSVAGRSPGVLARLLARENLPAAPARAADRSPAFLARLLSRESLPRGGDAPVDPPRTPE